ncbi:MAG: isopentenyl-diphosphate Delta-isomerase [Clostridia bacterium]|nr:isopentenyl-diphosphate Delta-isomerase [Clostridia bacterium]
MNNKLIAVDIFDNQIGTVSKEEAHKKPVLHRAFSVFLYHDNKILIQRRAFSKYHSGGLWANTCCSHPRTNDILADAKQRLSEEVGIVVEKNSLSELYSFTYLSKYAENLYEYEFDHVIVGEYDGSFALNKDEVEEMRWADINELATDIVKNPKKYATWFLICAPKVIEYINKK